MLYYVISCYIMLYYVILCYIMLNYVKLCYIVFKYVQLCYIVLYYVILCVILCYIVLYCIVLHCIVVYCIVLYCNCNCIVLNTIYYLDCILYSLLFSDVFCGFGYSKSHLLDRNFAWRFILRITPSLQKRVHMSVRFHVGFRAGIYTGFREGNPGGRVHRCVSIFILDELMWLRQLVVLYIAGFCININPKFAYCPPTN